VDDARFAAARAEALAGRGFGDEAIRQLLEGDGVAAEAAEQAMAGLTPERERAEALAVRLGRTAKVVAQLQRKGFGLDALEGSFEGVFADRDDAA
jgi:SOS response regulatory protein OraA/RecX